MAEQELKACPFCGSAAHQLGKTTVTCLTRIGGGNGTCCAVAPSADEWNTRPIEDALTARLSSAEAEVKRLRKRNGGEILFMLYGGSSCDGRGPSDFEKWTFDADEAEKHLKRIRKDPYSTGRVTAYAQGLPPEPMMQFRSQLAQLTAAARRQQGGTDAR